MSGVGDGVLALSMASDRGAFWDAPGGGCAGSEP